MPFGSERAVAHAYCLVLSEVNKYKTRFLPCSPCHRWHGYLACTITVGVITETMGVSTEHNPAKGKLPRTGFQLPNGIQNVYRMQK